MDIRNFPGRNILLPAFYFADSTLNTETEVDAPNARVGAEAKSEDLLSIVQRQFMRMNEAHDRHRTKVLASYSPGMKLKGN